MAIKKSILELEKGEVIYASNAEEAEILRRKLLELRWVEGDFQWEKLKGGFFDIYNHEIATLNNCDFNQIHKIYTIEDLADFDEEPLFKRGEKILVNCHLGLWEGEERIFVGHIEGAKHPYVCVIPEDEAKFYRNEPFLTSSWPQAKKITTKKITRAEIAGLLGTDDFEIID